MILAIDPGTTQSAWVLMDEQYRPLGFAKEDNTKVKAHIATLAATPNYLDAVVVEMMSSYGMPVGKEVLDACVWIGRFIEACPDKTRCATILRREVKLNLCHSARAKDGNAIQALKDRFGDKGTKAAPGWFYGFKADCWQAYALGVTWLDGCEFTEVH